MCPKDLRRVLDLALGPHRSIIEDIADAIAHMKSKGGNFSQWRITGHGVDLGKDKDYGLEIRITKERIKEYDQG